VLSARTWRALIRRALKTDSKFPERMIPKVAVLKEAGPSRRLSAGAKTTVHDLHGIFWVA
jgi:hypothetical protein